MKSEKLLFFYWKLLAVLILFQSVSSNTFYGKLVLKISVASKKNSVFTHRPTVFATRRSTYLKKDGDVFKIHMPGIAKNHTQDSISFESVRFPSYFLRHKKVDNDYRFRIAKQTDQDKDFQSEATFLIQRHSGIDGSGMLKLFDDPKNYLCVRKYNYADSALEAMKNDNTEEFRARCSFFIQKLKPENVNDAVKKSTQANKTPLNIKNNKKPNVTIHENDNQVNKLINRINSLKNQPKKNSFQKAGKLQNASTVKQTLKTINSAATNELKKQQIKQQNKLIQTKTKFKGPAEKVVRKMLDDYVKKIEVESKKSIQNQYSSSKIKNAAQKAPHLSAANAVQKAPQLSVANAAHKAPQLSAVNTFSAVPTANSWMWNNVNAYNGQSTGNFYPSANPYGTIMNSMYPGYLQQQQQQQLQQQNLVNPQTNMLSYFPVVQVYDPTKQNIRGFFQKSNEKLPNQETNHPVEVGTVDASWKEDTSVNLKQTIPNASGKPQKQNVSKNPNKPKKTNKGSQKGTKINPKKLPSATSNSTHKYSIKPITSANRKYPSIYEHSNYTHQILKDTDQSKQRHQEPSLNLDGTPKNVSISLTRSRVKSSLHKQSKSNHHKNLKQNVTSSSLKKIGPASPVNLGEFSKQQHREPSLNMDGLVQAIPLPNTRSNITNKKGNNSTEGNTKKLNDIVHSSFVHNGHHLSNNILSIVHSTKEFESTEGNGKDIGSKKTTILGTPLSSGDSVNATGEDKFITDSSVTEYIGEPLNKTQPKTVTAAKKEHLVDEALHNFTTDSDIDFKIFSDDKNDTIDTAAQIEGNKTTDAAISNTSVPLDSDKSNNESLNADKILKASIADVSTLNSTSSVQNETVSNNTKYDIFSNPHPTNAMMNNTVSKDMTVFDSGNVTKPAIENNLNSTKNTSSQLSGITPKQREINNSSILSNVSTSAVYPKLMTNNTLNSTSQRNLTEPSHQVNAKSPSTSVQEDRHKEAYKSDPTPKLAESISVDSSNPQIQEQAQREVLQESADSDTIPFDDNVTSEGTGDNIDVTNNENTVSSLANILGQGNEGGIEYQNTDKATTLNDLGSSEMKGIANAMSELNAQDVTHLKSKMKTIDLMDRNAPDHIGRLIKSKNEYLNDKTLALQQNTNLVPQNDASSILSGTAQTISDSQVQAVNLPESSTAQSEAIAQPLVTADDLSHEQLSSFSSQDLEPHTELGVQDSLHTALSEQDAAHSGLSGQDSTHTGLTEQDSTHNGLIEQDSTHTGLTEQDLAHTGLTEGDPAMQEAASVPVSFSSTGSEMTSNTLDSLQNLHQSDNLHKVVHDRSGTLDSTQTDESLTDGSAAQINSNDESSEGAGLEVRGRKDSSSTMTMENSLSKSVALVKEKINQVQQVTDDNDLESLEEHSNILTPSDLEEDSSERSNLMRKKPSNPPVVAHASSRKKSYTHKKSSHHSYSQNNNMIVKGIAKNTILKVPISISYTKSPSSEDDSTENHKLEHIIKDVIHDDKNELHGVKPEANDVLKNSDKPKKAASTETNGEKTETNEVKEIQPSFGKVRKLKKINHDILALNKMLPNSLENLEPGPFVGSPRRNHPITLLQSNHFLPTKTVMNSPTIDDINETPEIQHEVNVVRHTHHVVTVNNDQEKQQMVNGLVDYNADRCVSLQLINDLGSRYRLISSINKHGYTPRGKVFTLKTVFKDPTSHKFVSFHAVDESDGVRQVTLDGAKELISVPTPCNAPPKIVHVASPVPCIVNCIMTLQRKHTIIRRKDDILRNNDEEDAPDDETSNDDEDDHLHHSQDASDAIFKKNHIAYPQHHYMVHNVDEPRERITHIYLRKSKKDLIEGYASRYNNLRSSVLHPTSSCIRTYGGTTHSAVECCIFPFTYNGELNNACIQDNGSSWCSLTRDFDQDKRWGLCMTQ